VSPSAASASSWSDCTGWLYHAFVVNFWEGGTDHHSDRTLRFAMLLFLITEVATFGAGFVYYFFIRGGAV